MTHAELFRLPPVRGVLEYSVYEDDVLVDRVTGANLVMTTGLAIFAGRIAGITDTAITHLAVGTGGAPPTVGDTGLTGAVSTPVLGANSPAAGQVAFHWTVDRLTANGMTIHEFGLLTAAGVLVARKTRSAGLYKTNKISVNGIWTFTF